MTTTLFGSLFSLPRTMYSMANDGLLFGFLGRVSERTRMPVWSLVISGILSALIALLFDLQHLVEFMSIGTLLAYTIVSASVIVLRYRPEKRLTTSRQSSVDTPSGLSSPPTEGADSSNSITSDSEVRIPRSSVRFFFHRNYGKTRKNRRARNPENVLFFTAIRNFSDLFPTRHRGNISCLQQKHEE